MKRNILFIIFSILLVACATKKPEKRSRFMKGFLAQYNTHFNAQQALEAEIKTRKEAHKEDFYAPFISIFPYEQPQETTTQNTTTDFVIQDEPEGKPFGGNFIKNAATELLKRKDKQNPNKNTPEETQKKPTTPLEIAEAKALKTIEKYSVLRNEEEKNNVVFDAYITLMKARIYMNKPIEALDVMNTINKRYKGNKLSIARIYEALAYSKMEDYARANKIFSQLENEKLNKQNTALLAIHHAETLLKADEKQKATIQLEKAFNAESKRETKSRIAFLNGQILLQQNNLSQARQKFQQAYEYAQDFEFEVKAQIQIAKTYNQKNDFSQAKKYLENLSKKGTYASRKNEFLYAIGIMANNINQKNEAKQYFIKALKEKSTDNQIKGLTYYELGKTFLQEKDYITANAYHDSAIAVMTHEPTKKIVQKQTENIKKVAQFYYLIKKNDSILALTKMTQTQQKEFFNTHITKLKEKEQQEEQKRLKEERQKDFQNSTFANTSAFGNGINAFQNFNNNSKTFYFSNTSNIARGINDFKQIWGDRALADNWRYSKKITTIDEIKAQALGQNTTPNPRRFQPEYYIEQIPTSSAQIQQIKDERDQAMLQLAIIFRDAFQDITLATQTLYTLVDYQPEEKTEIQALYQIFAMNHQNNPTQAQKAKNILIQKYPYTPYAEFAKNPRANSFVKASPEAENQYQKAYFMYEQGRYEEARNVTEQALQTFKTDALIPKFSLLNAYIAGKINGKEVMILQLEQILLNYEKTLEAEKAKQILNTLKNEPKQNQNTQPPTQKIPNQLPPNSNIKFGG